MLNITTSEIKSELCKAFSIQRSQVSIKETRRGTAYGSVTVRVPMDKTDGVRKYLESNADRIGLDWYLGDNYGTEQKYLKLHVGPINK